MRATLKRMAAPSLFGADVEELLFQAEMQSKNRLRFKVAHTHTAVPSSLSQKTEEYGMVMGKNCDMQPASHT